MANSGKARVVFWEAKRFGDARLRSSKGAPEVTAQIKAYQDYFADLGRQAAVRAAYKATCQALIRFTEMDPAATEIKLDPIIKRVATDAVALAIDPTPRLVIFGSAEEFGRASWQEHEQKLTANGVPVLRLRTDAYALTQGDIGLNSGLERMNLR